MNSSAMAATVDFKNFVQFTCGGCQTPSLCPKVTCGVTGKVSLRKICQNCLMDRNLAALNRQLENPGKVAEIRAKTIADVAKDDEIFAYKQYRHNQLATEWRETLSSWYK